jgi:hypothetical protein
VGFGSSDAARRALRGVRANRARGRGEARAEVQILEALSDVVDYVDYRDNSTRACSRNKSSRTARGLPQNEYFKEN